MQRLKKCPYCGSKRVVRVIYGEPTFEDGLAKMRGEAVLGGEIIGEDSPSHACLVCGRRFGGVLHTLEQQREKESDGVSEKK